MGANGAGGRGEVGELRAKDELGASVTGSGNVPSWKGPSGIIHPAAGPAWTPKSHPVHPWKHSWSSGIPWGARARLTELQRTLEGGRFVGGLVLLDAEFLKN